MFKLPHNCIHFTYQQGNAQNTSSQASTVCQPRTSRCTRLIQKRQRKQRSNCQDPLDHRKGKGIPEKIISFCFIEYVKVFESVDYNKLWKILQEMGIPDQLACLLRNLYAGQEATVRTGHGSTDNSKLVKDNIKAVY